MSKKEAIKFDNKKLLQLRATASFEELDVKGILTGVSAKFNELSNGASYGEFMLNASSFKKGYFPLETPLFADHKNEVGMVIGSVEHYIDEEKGLLTYKATLNKEHKLYKEVILPEMKKAKSGKLPFSVSVGMMCDSIADNGLLEGARMNELSLVGIGAMPSANIEKFAKINGGVDIKDQTITAQQDTISSLNLSVSNLELDKSKLESELKKTNRQLEINSMFYGKKIDANTKVKLESIINSEDQIFNTVRDLTSNSAGVHSEPLGSSSKSSDGLNLDQIAQLDALLKASTHLTREQAIKAIKKCS